MEQQVANFIATLRDGERAQTFGFSGETSLDQLFEIIEKRNRGDGVAKSFAAIASELRSGDEYARVFRLTINRNETDEPAIKTLSEELAEIKF
jgi:hypothetical protein